MVSNLHRLTALWVAKCRKVGLHADGACLYLKVAPRYAPKPKQGKPSKLPGVTKSWVFRYGQRGKHVMGLGRYPDVTLKSAREKAAQYRSLRDSGVDPLSHKRATKRQAIATRDKTFELCAEEFVAREKEGWTNPKSEHQWRRSLKNAAEVFGATPVKDITVDDVIEVIAPIWTKTPDTADKVLQRVSSVFEFAIAQDWRTAANPANRRSLVKGYKLPKRKARVVSPHASLPYTKAPQFFRYMRERTGSISAQALELLILTGLRTNELIGGQWNEIEWDDKLWIIPRERTKTRINHHEVPLSKGALQVLKAQWGVRSMTDDREYIFPGLKPDQPLSTAAMHSLIKPSNGREPWPFTDPKQGNKTISVHGFRSTLRDWGSETGKRPELMEKILNHSLRDKVEAAYQRSQLTEQRRPIMEEWWEFCSSRLDAEKDNVEPMRKRKASLNA